MRSAKSRFHTDISEGKAVKVASVSGGSDNEKWTEELIGLLAPKNDNVKLRLLKYGGMDSKYSARNLRENNHNRRAGSKGVTISEGEAREWIKDNSLDEGNMEDFLNAYELLQELRT